MGNEGADDGADHDPHEVRRLSPTLASLRPVGRPGHWPSRRGPISRDPARRGRVSRPTGYRPLTPRLPVGRQDLNHRDNRPALRIDQTSDLGRSQQDFFFWNGQGPMQLLVVTGNGSTHQWQQLMPGWDNPHMAHAPPVSLGRFNEHRPGNMPVSSMTTAEKVAQAMLRSMQPRYMSDEVANVVKGLLTPEAIGHMLAIEALYAVSMFFGVGEVATALLVVMGTYYVGEQVITMLRLLKDFIGRVTTTHSEADLEAAAQLFAQIMVMGTQMVVMLLTRTRSRAHGNHTVLRMKSGRGGGGGRKTPKYKQEPSTTPTGGKKGKTEHSAPTYHQPPKTLPGFPKTRKTKQKNQRKRWVDENGDIYEWDYQHGKVEVYGNNGKTHKGEFDPNTGQRTKDADPSRTTDPE